MSQANVPAQYLQIALDLATRIARGELAEGSRIYGRSVMASEYSVSPETIRKAIRILAGMKVVEVHPCSGVTVLSADSARRYIAKFEGTADVHALRQQLKSLFDEYSDLNSRTLKVMQALMTSQDSYSAAGEPLPNYEVPVAEGARVIGKSVGELKFWQATGGTIVAIRRGQHVILSPGPYAELFAGDLIVLVGDQTAVTAATRLLSEKEESNHDSV